MLTVPKPIPTAQPTYTYNPSPPQGTGKTLTVSSKLSGGMPPEAVPIFLTFSARTSANMVQDIIGESIKIDRG
jgi:hypothetical protein